MLDVNIGNRNGAQRGQLLLRQKKQGPMKNTPNHTNRDLILFKRSAFTEAFGAKAVTSSKVPSQDLLPRGR